MNLLKMKNMVDRDRKIGLMIWKEEMEFVGFFFVYIIIVSIIFIIKRGL